MFDVHLTILHVPTCRIIHLHVHPNIPHTHHDARRSPYDFVFLSFPETNFPGTIFPGTDFPGTIFPGVHFSEIRQKLGMITPFSTDLPLYCSTGAVLVTSRRESAALGYF